MNELGDQCYCEENLGWWQSLQVLLGEEQSNEEETN